MAIYRYPTSDDTSRPYSGHTRAVGSLSKLKACCEVLHIFIVPLIRIIRVDDMRHFLRVIKSSHLERPGASQTLSPSYKMVRVEVSRSQTHSPLMAQTEIWTERLLLRAAEERDLLAFKKFMWDEEAMKYW